MNDADIKKLCYDLALIYAKDALQNLSTNDSYLNKTDERIDYLYGAFEESYSFLSNQPKEYFKHLLK